VSTTSLSLTFAAGISAQLKEQISKAQKDAAAGNISHGCAIERV
jgi:hypothetical protein